MQTDSEPFLLGLAVWAFPDFFGSFYPDSILRNAALSEYGKRLHCVECNSTFYAQPDVKVFESWAEQVPEAFRFVPKLSQQISHKGLLAEKGQLTVAQVKQIQQGLGSRCGPFMLQLPPSYSPKRGGDLSQFLNGWRRSNLGPISVEFRHPDWWAPEWSTRTRIMLEGLKMGRIILDTRAIYAGTDDPQKNAQNKKPSLPVDFDNHHETVIVRYIAHPEEARNERYWNEWTVQISNWLDEGRQVYFFMHCPQEQFSPSHARSFHQKLRECRPQLPALPWAQLPPDPQLPLF